MRRGWLFDETVNAYMFLLNERDARMCVDEVERKPTFFFSSFFFKKVGKWH
jgi:Ulp1 family protease